jgi:hypothetical protein
MKLISLLPLPALAGLTTAHFLLHYPPTLGFSDDNESIAPCGGFPVVFNSSDVQVQADGFPIALTSIHPESDWLFRATLSHSEPFNWTNLLPVVHETGLGDFCIPDFKVPAEFVGHSALLQIMQNAIDGLLYQVEGIPESYPVAELAKLTLLLSLIVLCCQLCRRDEYFCWTGLQQRHWLDGHYHQPERVLKRVRLISNDVNKLYERSIRNVIVITRNITTPQ